MCYFQFRDVAQFGDSSQVYLAKFGDIQNMDV
jgi:hypothetical protein